jgi:oligoendopeptidase F
MKGIKTESLKEWSMAILQRKDAIKESTWNRESVYASWADWKKEYDQEVKELPELSEYKGKLKDGPGALADWFEVYSRHYERVAILGDFARLAVTVDSSDEEAKGYQGLSIDLSRKFKTAVAFMKPQLLEIGETLLTWVKEEPRLAPYRHFFDNLLRLKAHQRSEEVEEILSALEEPYGDAYRTFSELANADLKFQDAIDQAGNHHPVFQATLGSSLQSSDRERRRTAWENYYDGYLSMGNTFASLYLTHVKRMVFLMNTRSYDSVLEMRLAPSNLPVEVFHNLVATFKKNLPVWHKYWAVKRKVLGVDALHPYDIWAPILDDSPVIPYRQSIEWICEALKPMGEEYVSILRRGSLEDGWVDWAPNVEKRQGAASSRMVGRKPPFLFMSYNDSVMSLSTLAHELGHSMHSYHFATRQPAVYNDYAAISSTVTETASNFHQAMTRAYLRKEKGDDRNFQLAMIDEAMSNFHRYFFIMPTLARFEQRVYEKAQAGEVLTTTGLKRMMSDLFAEGYGDTMVDDPDRTAITWAQFLHLYIPFYSFQYAIGISAAHAAADRILTGEKGAAEGYLEFLKAGGSKYSMDLFKLAGVDMSSPEPVNKAFKELEENVDLLEKLA